ncbi:MAG: hypothetical protein JNG90_06720 [Planctomycetaceae bacterium]|nr:hypothetical protein [Planctomycetaceae bacterium]
MTEQPTLAVQWFFGRVTSVAAELFLRVRWPGAEDGPTLPLLPKIHQVSVAGPRSRYARTLEHRLGMTPVVGDTGLWHATLAEPCFWTPQQPYVYVASLHVELQNGVTSEISLQLGVPVLVARQRRLEQEGRNFVLRGAALHRVDTLSLAKCHDSSTALVLSQPSDEVCAEATSIGVGVVADLGQLPATEVAAELRRVALWPAVRIAILPSAARLEPALRQETAHVVRAQRWTPADAAGISEWAQVLVSERGDVLDGMTPREELPVLVWAQRCGEAGQSDNPDAADSRTQVELYRQACDSLQAEVAGQREFAGYLVG